MPKKPDATAALYQAILDDPDDVARRLVYADALQEAGDPRGELIARMAADPDQRLPTHHLRSADYGDDEELIALYKKQAKRWVDPLKPYLGLDNATWWCGVIDEMKVDTAKLAKGAAEVFEAMPIRTLWLVGRKSALPKLAAVAAMRSVRKLDLNTYERQPPVTAKLLAGLAGPAFAHLREVDLGGNFAGDAALEALLEATPTARYRTLWLTNNRLTDASATLLATAPNTAALEDLTLAYNDVTDAGVRALVESPAAARLRRLDVTGIPISAATFAALLDTRRLKQLTDLRARKREVPAAHRAAWAKRFPSSESF